MAKKTKPDVAAEIWSKRDEALEWIQPEMLTWDTVRRFLDGLQYGQFSERSGTWVTEPSRPGVSRVTVNLMLPIYNRIQAVLDVAIPHIGVRPAASTTEELMRAKVCGALVQFIWEKQRLVDVFARTNEWLTVTGNGFIHPYYDPDKEEINFDAVSPYDVLWQQGVSEVNDSEWLIRRSYMFKGAIERAYPDVELDKTTPAEEDVYRNRSNFTYSNAPSGEEEQYEVLEYWDRSGKHCIVIGSQVAWEGDDWDPHHRYPLVHMKFNSLPGRAHGISALAQTVQVQREYNAQRSAIITNIRRMGNLQWVVASNSGVDEITNEPGAIIRFNAASHKPSQVQLSPLPGYVLDNVNRSHSEMMDLAGIHGTSLGKRVTGIQSGKAIDSMVQQDVHQLQAVMKSIQSAGELLSKSVVALAKRYYTKRRMVRVFRHDGGMFFKLIKGTDLYDDPDIFFEAGTMFKMHLAEREQRAVQLLQLGLLTPPEARKALSFFGHDAQVQQQIRNYNTALDTLEDVLAGDTVIILPTDPIEEIQEVFQEYMSSEGFDELPVVLRDNITDIMVSLVAQGNPQVAQAVSTPLHPRQPQQQPQQQQPGLMQPSSDAARQGGTAEGAATRTANQQAARVFEGFDARRGDV